MLLLMYRMGLFLLLFWAYVPVQAQVSAIHGEIDLQDWKGQPLRLNGDWRFYPNELLSPDAYLQRLDAGDEAATWIPVGQSFQESGRGSMTNIGFGTYVLHLKNIPDIKSLAFSDISAYSAFRAFLFNRQQGRTEPALTAGQVSQSQHAASPAISTIEVALIPDAMRPETFLLIQVSNFHHEWGGLWIPPQLGPRQALLAEYAGELKRNFLVIGALLMTALYNFSLYSRRREDKGSLMLGFLSLVLILRSLGYMGQAEAILHNLETNFNFTFKFIYISMIVSPLLVLHFQLDYFPRQTPRRLIWLLTLMCTPLIIFFAFTDPLTFTKLGVVGQYLGITLGALCMFTLGRALIAGEPGAVISNLGTFAVFVGAVLDMVSAAGAYQFPANCIGYGLVIFTLAQSQIIGVRFAEAFRKAHHLGKSLQLEVDRQTREIKSIMQSIELGIFTVIDENLHIGDQYSTHLKTMTHQDHIQGRSIDTLLFENARITADIRDQARSALSSSLNSDLLNFEMNSHCLPQQMIVQGGDAAAPQVWEMDWTPIVNSENIVEKVLVCVRDITDILRLKEKARDQESHLAMINELILVAEDRFSRFLSASQNLIRENQSLLDAHPLEPQPAVLRKLFMNMHTLKGMARTYQFMALSAAAHQAEQCFAHLQKNSGSWPMAQMKDDLKQVAQTLEAYEHIGRTQLGWDLGQRILRIHKSRLEGMLQDLQSIPLKRLDPALQVRIASVENRLGSECYRPVRDIIQEACKGADSLARSLDKQPPAVEIEASEIYFRDPGADLIHSVLTHLMRNMLDHGLEPPMVRQAAGKNPQGTIAIRVNCENPNVLLTIHDDGRGLDLDRIEALGREKGSIPQGASWTDEKVAELIFQTNFSTAREVTEISGRGVGMDAVRTFLQEKKGDIALQFTAARHQGFRSFAFVISIPNELCWFPQEGWHATASPTVA